MLNPSVADSRTSTALVLKAINLAIGSRGEPEVGLRSPFPTNVTEPKVSHLYVGIHAESGV